MICLLPYASMKLFMTSMFSLITIYDHLLFPCFLYDGQPDRREIVEKQRARYKIVLSSTAMFKITIDWKWKTTIVLNTFNLIPEKRRFIYTIPQHKQPHISNVGSKNFFNYNFLVHLRLLTNAIKFNYQQNMFSGYGSELNSLYLKRYRRSLLSCKLGSSVNEGNLPVSASLISYIPAWGYHYGESVL